MERNKPFQQFSKELNEIKRKGEEKKAAEDLDRMINDPNWYPGKPEENSSESIELVFTEDGDMDIFDEEDRDVFLQDYNYKKPAFDDIVDWEEKDISGLVEFKESQEEIWQDNLEKREDYSNEEIEILEEAKKLKNFLVENNLSNIKEPLSADGSKLSKEGIKKLVHKHRTIKREGSWKNFSKEDLKLMKEASTWNYLQNKLNSEQGQSFSRIFNGNNLNYEQLSNAVNELDDLYKNDLDRIKRYKLESGKWESGVLKWREEEYKGKKQLVAYIRRKEKDSSGKEIMVTSKIVVEKNKDNSSVLEEGQSFSVIEPQREIKVKNDYKVVLAKIVESQKFEKRGKK